MKFNEFGNLVAIERMVDHIAKIYIVHQACGVDSYSTDDNLCDHFNLWETEDEDEWAMEDLWKMRISEDEAQKLFTFHMMNHIIEKCGLGDGSAVKALKLMKEMFPTDVFGEFPEDYILIT